MQSDGVRELANAIIKDAEAAQKLIIQARDEIRMMQTDILLLDLGQGSNSMHVRSVSRLAPLIGKSIDEDLEALGAVRSEMLRYLRIV